jgi:hypothetical protein
MSNNIIAWNANTRYTVNDTVYYDSNTYEALQVNQNVLPSTLAPNWIVVSASVSTYSGSFSSSATQLQTGGVANTPTAIVFNTIEYQNGITLATLPSSSEIYVPVNGVYKFSYSIQLDKSGGGNSLCDIWIRVNGNNVPRSASRCIVAGQTGETFPYCEYILNLTGGDKIQVIFASSDATMAATAFPATATIPAIPSIISNIYRLS